MSALQSLTSAVQQVSPKEWVLFVTALLVSPAIYLVKCAIRYHREYSELSMLVRDWHVYHFTHRHYRSLFRNQIWRVRRGISGRLKVVAIDYLAPDLVYSGHVSMESGRLVMTFKAIKHPAGPCHVHFHSITPPGHDGMIMRGILLDCDLDGIVYAATLIASSQPLAPDLAQRALQQTTSVSATEGALRIQNAPLLISHNDKPTSGPGQAA